MIWVKGSIVADDALRVSALDRAFEHGLGLFETFRTWQGRAPLLARHLARLRRSAAELGLPLEEIALPGPDDVAALLKAQGSGPDARLRLTLTGGLDATSGSTLFLRAGPLPPPPPPTGATVAVGLWAVAPADALARHKSLNYWSRRRASEAARRLGDDEALSSTPDGALWEGSRTNLFAVRGPSLLTPTTDGPIVPGIMRSLVIEWAGAVEAVHGLTLEALARCEEVFLTNSVRGLIPVARVGPHDYAAPGPCCARLTQLAADRLEKEDAV